MLGKLDDPKRPWLFVAPKELRELLKEYKTEIKAVRSAKAEEQGTVAPRPGDVSIPPTESVGTPNSEDPVNPPANTAGDAGLVNCASDEERIDKQIADHFASEQAQMDQIEQELAKLVQQAGLDEEKAIVQGLIVAKSNLGSRIMDYWQYRLSM